MARVALTGATGLIGTEIAATLRQANHHVVALARPSANTKYLESIGIEVVRGDVSDRESVNRAVRDAEVVIHLAAILGGAVRDPFAYETINFEGSVNVFDAAQRYGARRVLDASSYACFDRTSMTMTETSRVDPDPAQDPYTLSKIRTFHDSRRRAELGQDIVTIVIGSTYGPSPLVERSMEPPSFNQRLAHGIRGTIQEFPPVLMPFVHVRDVSQCFLAAMTKGSAGDRFLAFGAVEDVTTIAGFVNFGCAIAGVQHQIRELTHDELQAENIKERFGATLIQLALKSYTNPLFDNSLTQRTLSITPLRLRDGLEETITWLRSIAHI